MAIYNLGDGTCVISSSRVWLPGVYENERAARFAFRLPNEELTKLQEQANARAGGAGGVITWDDIAIAARMVRRRR